MNPIVIACHLVWTAYGWWLPNDPRGSMSRTIRFDLLSEIGELHYGRKRLQPASRDIRAFYEMAEGRLVYPLLEFDRAAIASIAAAFGATIAAHKYTCYACAIMPDHVHLVIRKHKHQAEEMIAHLQESSRPPRGVPRGRSRLRADTLRPEDHPVWGGPGWKVFLDHPDEVRREIRYVEENPLKLRWAAQHWPFVSAYDGWPLHPGHNPNSPYARRLRAVGRYPF